MELRSHRRRQFQSSTAASASVNNSFRDALPSSSLPSVPSSPFAYEPGHHDQEMKLVLPQSTPNIDGSPKLPTPLHNDAFSPIAYRASPFTSSGNSKRLSKLSISGRSYLSRKSKPKRLDFSKRAILAGFEKRRATPDYTGKETVDIFKLLVDKSNHPRIVSKILSYLSPQDLCSVNIVSKSWQRICGSDSKAEERRLKHVILRQCTKENISMNKSKFEQAIHHMSPRTRSQGREYLTVVSTNLLPVPKIHSTPTSPPVSPSKVIFHSFIKARRSLAPREQLVPCPQCKFACRVEQETHVGRCSRRGCPMLEFCALCSSQPHRGEPCKMPLLATPTKRGTRPELPVVGTKLCRRNLRRLSRLSR